MSLKEKLIVGWNIVALFVLGIGIALLLNYVCAPKHVYSYAIGSDDNNNGLYIRVDIENSVDDKIAVNGLSLERVTAIVDSLNAHIVKEK